MSRPIRVLLISDSLNSGGKERQLIEIIKQLNPQSFSIGIITFNPYPLYAVEALKYSVFYKELAKRPTRLEPFFSIWSCFRKFDPDLVHTWDTLSTIYSILPCKRFGISLIDGSIRDAGLEKHLGYYSKRFFLKRANIVLSNSFAGLKAYKIKGYVIYNGIDTNRFLEKFVTDRFNIIMTANFTKYKDHKTFLIAAIKLLQDQIIDFVYLIGDGPLRIYYMDWISKKYPEIKDRFCFPGCVTNVEEYLSKCRIGVLCSTFKYSEGLSNAILEYMAGGLVSIATKTGAITEIIQEGINGFLVKPGDASDVIRLIRTIKDNSHLEKTIVNNAKMTILESFNVVENVHKLENLYFQIARPEVKKS
jgi:glycosyltransferase involved in cell wall biosynthesis